MAINQLSTSNTFTEWLSATSLLISNVNNLTDNTGGGFVANSSIFLQGSAASLNVRTLANINTLQANTANIGNTNFAGSNVTIQLDLVVGRNVSTPTLYANNIFQGGVNVAALALQILPAFSQANAGFTAANSAGVYANGAFVRANNALNANVGGTITGNVVIAGSNLSVSNGATEIFNVRSHSTSGLSSISNSTGTVTITGGMGIKGNVYAHEVYDNGLRIVTQANAAFAQANIALTQANAAFIAANSSGVYANGAFIRANNALNANAGGTITGNLVISNANLSVSNGATELFNVRSHSASGLPATSNSTGTVTVTGGMGIKGNVYAHEVYDNGLRIVTQANLAFTQANIALTQANAAFAQANIALTQANAAFIRANNSLDANVGGTITGNVTIAGANLAVSNGATQVFNVRSWSASGLSSTSNSTGTVTITGGIGIKGNVYADAIYDGGVEILLHANAAFAQSNIALTQANAAFAQANISLTQANAAFAQANIALTQANAAFAQANVTLIRTNSAFDTANAASIRANNSLDANNGGVVTGAVTVTSASGLRLETGSGQDAILIRGRSGGSGSFAATITPATLTGNITATIPSENFTVGFRNIPASGTRTTSYVLATTDVGKYVRVSTGGSITIPDGIFSEGDVVTIFNDTNGDVTITCSIAVAYIAAYNLDVASMTLASRGLATIIFTSSTSCVVMGNVS